MIAEGRLRAFCRMSGSHPNGIALIIPQSRASSFQRLNFLRQLKFRQPMLAETMKMRAVTENTDAHLNGINSEMIHTAAGHPFTAPAVIPSTKYFCTSANRITTGIVVTVPSAMMMPQSMCVELI